MTSPASSPCRLPRSGTNSREPFVVSSTSTRLNPSTSATSSRGLIFPSRRSRSSGSLSVTTTAIQEGPGGRDPGQGDLEGTQSSDSINPLHGARPMAYRHPRITVEQHEPSIYGTCIGCSRANFTRQSRRVVAIAFPLWRLSVMQQFVPNTSLFCRECLSLVQQQASNALDRRSS